MESKSKLFGHPIHPMLIVFPLGLFIAAVMFDILYLSTNNTSWAIISFWNIAGGIIGGLLAAIFGFWDWLAIPGNTRAKSVGSLHGFGNVVVIVLFAMSWLLRWPEPAYVPTVLTLILELIAVGVGTVSGWLGGELVNRLGVGVDSGAHLNAPSSLSNRPATMREASYAKAGGDRSRRVHP
jgi:uncharacterized membrane protein